MKKILLLCLAVSLPLFLFAQKPLGEQAAVSVLTCAPSDEEVFTLYGHAAFRIQDPDQHLDLIFNYGIFDFSKPNFIYRFAKGETDYMLGVADYLPYIMEYQMRGSTVTEQTLNLTQEEKNHLWQALATNAQPQNRIYRYNFFFDNCATRLPALIERYADGKVLYADRQSSPPTFRDMINHCTRNHPWLTFGCDLALGSPTDRPATFRETMFLPEYLKKALADAAILAPDGTSRPLVSETHTLEAATQGKAATDLLTDIFTPLTCAWLLFLLTAVLTLHEWRSRTYCLPLDLFLFTLAGLTGLVLFFLCFLSEHPSVCPNWSVLWLHPLHLVAAAFLCTAKSRNSRHSRYYHALNFTLLILLLIGWHFIPQHLNTAFFPLTAVLCLRSARLLCPAGARDFSPT
ncbi:hypothetical protein Barb4_01861 [Bacteroidales bacterium Barb4]|nr:hypothetical protein Barb4_01861 [Bacteroidales bacterium Barb4]